MRTVHIVFMDNDTAYCTYVNKEGRCIVLVRKVKILIKGHVRPVQVLDKIIAMFKVKNKLMTRFNSDKTKCATLELLYASPNFYSCRAYERQAQLNDHGNRIQVGDHFYGDISYRTAKKSKEEANHKDAYALVNQLFPELAGKGLKAEGYVKYEVSEIAPIWADLLGATVQTQEPPAPAPTVTREGSGALKKAIKKR